jgi:hypothetical protein
MITIGCEDLSAPASRFDEFRSKTRGEAGTKGHTHDTVTDHTDVPHNRADSLTDEHDHRYGHRDKGVQGSAS